ncbi:ferritin, heavy subunit-like [Mastomys coucha]|uniref:ferritin, heavy subunit-like n=1 Tax=Mastomys coucha TaxID=35658 RepID=UPI001261FC7E|nr:ferritin, heavy subunit-like [Mastomys coucha]
MGPKKSRTIPEETLPFIHQAVCIQMNLSDAYLFLAYLCSNDVTLTGFGAYSRDKSSMKWFYAKSILTYVSERGSKVCIPDIQRPEIDTQGCIQCATAILNMERKLSEILQDLQDLTLNIRDNETLEFTKELIFKQRRIEDRLAWEIDKLRTREEEEAQKKDDKDETGLQGSSRQKSRK